MSYKPEKEIERISEVHDRILKELSKVIIGQQDVINDLLIALFSGGHALIVGVPGLAKTLLVRSLASILDLKFSRIQFTPDLMPSDILGSDVLQEDPTTGKKVFRFIPGPIFANIILADEINRTPPKTQAALLEAMQELKVTVGGRDYVLEPPFFVLATQNPIEQEGTYPLPEAQLDRFMFEIRIDYPDEEEEKKIVTSTTGPQDVKLEPVIEKDEILKVQSIVRQVPPPDHVVDYAVRLVRATRPGKEAPKFVRDFVEWGAGPRASQYLILGAKTHALMNGRPIPSTDDVKAVARQVLRHRVIVNFAAEAEGVTSDDVIEQLLREIE